MDDLTTLGGLPTVVTLIIALSVATERLVEIIKGLVPSLDRASEIPAIEGRRRAKLQLLAAGGGIVISYLAWPVSSQIITSGPSSLTIVALGLLASGGSGFWNTILSHVTKLKDLRAVDLQQAKQALAEGRPLPRPTEGTLNP